MSTPLAQNPTHENAEIQKIILQTRDAAEGRATQSSLGKDSPLVVYFSSISGNTHKFVEKLQARNVRLPLRTKDETPVRQLRGVIGSGNTNFGSLFGIAADIVAKKCDVPLLFKFELMGTSSDVEKVNKGLEEFWTQNCLQR